MTVSRMLTSIVIFGGGAFIVVAYIYKGQRQKKEKTFLYQMQKSMSKYSGDPAAKKAALKEEMAKKMKGMTVTKLSEMLKESMVAK